MEHLNAETIARLVDERPSSAEREHLEGCTVCAHELEAYRSQSEALGGLPEILPPQNDWRVLEARMRSDGLIRDPGLFERLGLAQTPSWMKAAAAVLLFLTGTGAGAMMTGERGDLPLSDMAMMEQAAMFASSQSVDEAASAVRVAEQNYVAALARYRELLMQDGGPDIGGDPISRMAALQTLVAASQAAVRQAPADPYFNGLLASALGEREATLRMVSTKDNWF